MVAQGVERVQAGKLSAAHFLTHQLQCHPAGTCNHLRELFSLSTNLWDLLLHSFNRPGKFTLIYGKLHPAEATLTPDFLRLIALKLGIFLYTEEHTSAPEWVLKPTWRTLICGHIRLDQEGSAAMV